MVVAALVTSCGGGQGDGRVTFTQVEVQAYLERETTRTLPGVVVGAANCPATLPRLTGETVVCTVRIGPRSVRYEVQRLVGDRFEARPTQPIVLVRDIATAIRTTLGMPQAEVQCAGGGPVLQPEPGQPVTCQVTGGGPPRTATVQVGPDGAVTVTDA